MRDVKCIVFGLALWALFGLYVTTADAAPHRAEIAAVVNDSIITTSDVETRLLLNTGGRAVPPSERQVAYNAVLDELINETLQRQEADSLNITVEQSQIDEAFAVVAQNNNMSAEQFRGQIQRVGVPPQVFYDKLRTDIAWGQVVRRKLRPQVAISENDFDTMARTAGEAQYRVAEIFLASDMMSDSAAVERKMDELIMMMQKGARFSDVAKKYSEAPGASRGGDLGFLTLDQLDEDFQPVVINMQPGELARPFKTAEGYHLLYLIDKKEAAETARPTIGAPQQPAISAPAMVRLQQLFIPVANDEPQALKNTKLARAAALKNEVSSCADMQAKASDFPSPLSGDLGLIPVTDLPDSVRAEVAELPIGALSRPMMNAKGIFVLMVCERPEPTPAAAPVATPVNAERNDEAAREQIANTLGMQKLETLQQRYLRDLRSAAFIDRRI